jgi:hypothetical protein
MAAVVHGIATTSGANASTYTSGAFTPAANDLLVVFVTAKATTDVATLSDSQGGTYSLIASGVKASGGDTFYVFVADQLASAVSMTVTFDCTGDAATSAVISVARVSGMTKTGATAARQTAKVENQTSGGTPAVTFASSVLTGNPTLALVANNGNPAGVTEPTGWTEQADTGIETNGAEYASRDSGFTGTTITWGSTSGSAFGALAIELDASASGATPTRGQLSFSELETPNTLTRGQLSFAVVEVPGALTRGQLSFGELEIPSLLTRGRMSFTEVQVDSVPARGQLSFAVFEVLDPGEVVIEAHSFNSLRDRRLPRDPRLNQ